MDNEFLMRPLQNKSFFRTPMAKTFLVLDL